MLLVDHLPCRKTRQVTATYGTVAQLQSRSVKHLTFILRVETIVKYLTNYFRRWAVRVLAVSGSLRDDSYYRKLLAVAAADAGAGVHVDIWDGLACLPICDEDLEAQGITLAVARLKEAIRTADAVLIASPEYNGSIPGGLKNALDWVSRPHTTNVLTRQTCRPHRRQPQPQGRPQRSG